MQKVAVIGMGKTGCSIVQFLLSQGVHCDAFDEQQVSLSKAVTCQLYCGELQEDILNQYDCIALSPGIHWQHPVLKKLRAQGKRIVGDLDLFAAHFKGRMLAVTGTNGKTTVVTLLHQLLEVPAVGNIGTPMLAILTENHDQAVLELSSFQLQRSAVIHPHYAVLLNIQPDHLDMHADAAEYEQAKLRLFAQQTVGDFAMLPADAHWHAQAECLKQRGVCVRRFGEGDVSLDVGWMTTAQGEALFWQQGQQSILCADMPVQGRHQQMNLAIVAQMASDLGVDSTKIMTMMQQFSGLPHRMQYVGHYHARDWFNDSKATNPDAAIAALNACDKVGWICGGLRKGIDLMPMLETVKKHVVMAWVIGTEPEAYVALLQQAAVPYHVVDDLEVAVAQAKLCTHHLAILLSPASASMDQFRNYAHRGDLFMQYIQEERSESEIQTF